MLSYSWHTYSNENNESLSIDLIRPTAWRYMVPEYLSFFSILLNIVHASLENGSRLNQNP